MLVVFSLYRMTSNRFPDALQGCGLKQSAAHLMVVSKGPLQGSPHSLFTFWSGSKSRILVAHLRGWLRIEDALTIWPLRFQGKFVVDDFLGGELDSFLLRVLSTQKNLTSIWLGTSLLQTFPGIWFQNDFQGFLKTFAATKTATSLFKPCHLDHADKSHWKSMVGRWNSGARPIFRGEKKSFRMFQEGAHWFHFSVSTRLYHAATGAKPFTSWLLPIRPRTEGARDRDAIPEQGRFLCSIENVQDIARPDQIIWKTLKNNMVHKHHTWHLHSMWVVSMRNSYFKTSIAEWLNKKAPPMLSRNKGRFF